MSIAWFVDHIDDVRSDLSVYHRIDEIERLTAERFLAYTRRLPVYGGAVAFQLREVAATAPAQQAAASEDPVAWNDITDLMRTDPLFMGVGEVVTVPAA